MSQEPPSNPERDPYREPGEKIPPALKEWARLHINEEEIAASIREIRETGGLQLSDFIQEIKEKVGAGRASPA